VAVVSAHFLNAWYLSTGHIWPKEPASNDAIGGGFTGGGTVTTGTAGSVGVDGTG